MDCPSKDTISPGSSAVCSVCHSSCCPWPSGPVCAGSSGRVDRIVSADLVDAALESTGCVQRRVRVLPSGRGLPVAGRGVVRRDRIPAGVGAAGRRPGPACVATPGSSALSQALRRVGVAPLRELFTLVRGPAVGAARWHGLLVCAIDGTSMFVPTATPTPQRSDVRPAALMPNPGIRCCACSRSWPVAPAPSSTPCSVPTVSAKPPTHQRCCGA
ncbi:transposase domain-containing protein [Mycobacterium marinum]|uniref:transposase domain-containing protein n=1 Tax=Mycobacterium marinum TaxID=1781 RepID=UPI003B2890AD